MTQVSSVHGATIDPICGATLDPGEAVGPLSYHGQRYHFCSHRCQAKFLSSPPQDLQREARFRRAISRAALSFA